jgi:dTDP-4-dehydrorhamnose reductase
VILLTGGSGRLGRELRSLIDCHAPTRQEFDIMRPSFPPDVSLIVHCAAYTDVARAERDRRACYELNVTGTRNLTAYPIVYISTEYVFSGMRGDYREDAAPSPVNYYACTKADGEVVARLAPRSLVIRCLFKPRPFPHPAACVDQFTTGDYVDIIAKQIAQCVKMFDTFKTHDTIHIGTGRKSTYDLARQTRDVDRICVADVAVSLPRDTSLNLEKWHGLSKAANGH